MVDSVEVIVENRLIKEKRDISIYHHGGKSGHIVSVNNSVTLPLGSTKGGDYLHLVLLQGPGELVHDCSVEIPGEVDFDFSSVGKLRAEHRAGRLCLKIPAGPPTWELKITLPGPPPSPDTPRRITITDSG